MHASLWNAKLDKHGCPFTIVYLVLLLLPNHHVDDQALHEFVVAHDVLMLEQQLHKLSLPLYKKLLQLRET